MRCNRHTHVAHAYGFNGVCAFIAMRWCHRTSGSVRERSLRIFSVLGYHSAGQSATSAFKAPDWCISVFLLAMCMGKYRKIRLLGLYKTPEQHAQTFFRKSKPSELRFRRGALLWRTPRPCLSMMCVNNVCGDHISFRREEKNEM